MSEKNELDAHLERILPASLRTLVSPPVNHALQVEVGELVHLVDQLVPPGNIRQGLHAGLWLLGDDLGRAHAMCQEIPTAQGTAWHAVVHRREGDFWNSKYWWRRAAGLQWAGMADAVDAVIAHHGKLAQPLRVCREGPTYRPDCLVDLVAACPDTGPPQLIGALVSLQRAEWHTLFHECLALAAYR